MIEQRNSTPLDDAPLPAGAAAGLVATIPMTIFMLLMHRLLPGWQKYALPPQQITQEMAQRTDLDQRLSQLQILGATLTLHFSYGAIMGSFYNAFTRKIAFPPILKGALFGLLVWAASYLGWLQVADFDAAAPEEPVKRNLLMISAHLIWGMVAGMVSHLLDSGRDGD